MSRNRYEIQDRAHGQDLDFLRAEGTERWIIVDRTTGRIVDEALTRYEARQAARNWNDNA